MLKEDVDWPSYPVECETATTVETRVITLTMKSPFKSCLWTRFSSFIKLKRFFAYCLRWKNKVSKLETHSGFISAIELRDAETRIIQMVQKE